MKELRAEKFPSGRVMAELPPWPHECSAEDGALYALQGWRWCEQHNARWNDSPEHPAYLHGCFLCHATREWKGGPIER